MKVLTREDLLDTKLEKIIEILGLIPDKKGLYNTLWGKKTLKGLKETLRNILS
jgi:hypothetical protein